MAQSSKRLTAKKQIHNKVPTKSLDGRKTSKKKKKVKLCGQLKSMIHWEGEIVIVAISFREKLSGNKMILPHDKQPISH